MAFVDNDELLICLVEQCSYLYDKSLKAYKDEKLKENGWMSIAEHLSTEPAAVKQWWTNLRDRFVRAYRDYTPQPPSGSAGGYPTKSIGFPYLKEMMWLAPFIRKRKLTSSVATSSTSQVLTQGSTVADSIESNEEHIAEFSVGSDGMLSPTLSVEVPIDLSESRPGSSQSGFTRPGSSQSGPTPRGGTPTTPSAKRMKTIHESMNDAISKFCQHKLESGGSTDSDISFMKSVVQDMQTLTPINKLRFKKDVLDLLIKYTDE